MNRSGLADFIFTSRRKMFDRCRYWKVNQDNVARNLLDYLDDEPSGFFDAEVYSSFYNDKNIIAGSFMFDEETITLRTEADISDVKKNDVVEFREEMYRISNVSKKPLRKNNQFTDDCGYEFFISLKR